MNLQRQIIEIPFSTIEMAEFRIGALISKASGDCDTLVAEFAESLRLDGWSVRGLLQRVMPGEQACQVFLVDIATGERHLISQDLGSGSDACCLDVSRLVEVGRVLREIPDQGADLVIFNRYGGLELAGEGFADEMLSLMARMIPVLVIVPERHLLAWREFTGGLALELPPDPVRLMRWFLGLQATSRGNASIVEES